MIPVTYYKAFDGQLFETAKECADYETHCKALANIINKLPDFDRESDGWVNGKVYYQHDPETIEGIFSEFCKYIVSKYGDFTLSEPLNKTTIEDMRCQLSQHDNPSFLALRYFNNIDDQYRQWYHKWYVNKPYDAKPMNP
jgi:hypothetical protein